MKHLTLLLTLSFITYNTACSSSVDINAELNQSRKASIHLGAQLKSKLMAAMQSGGPIEALTVCHLDAANISTNISSTNNFEVGRTSLKLRNPSNQPDAWEVEQLKWFESQNNSGIDTNSLEVHEVIKQGDKTVFRYMKAIVIQEPCLLCHGAKLNLSIAEKIKDLYPQDQAKGYQLGQIRGAFTIKKPL